MNIKCNFCGTVYAAENSSCPNCPEKRFGEIALATQQLSESTLDEVLQYQKQKHNPQLLGRILAEKSILSELQVNKILALQKITVFICRQCQHFYNVRHFDANKSTSLYYCLKCQSILSILGLDISLMRYQYGGYLPHSIRQRESESRTLQPGEKFAHYLIEKKLGWGGMGVVYKAYDTKLERVVALKVISTDCRIRPGQIQRFTQEARAMAQLHHPNIVMVFEVGNTPQNYFTMEYIHGQSLAQKIRQRRIAPLSAANIAQKVAYALHTAHQCGIVHRDIKPANIMLTANNFPKVLDFGLAKIVDHNLSYSGAIVGTPAYMSPEQAQGKEVDARSDIYSLGITLYESLTGMPLFLGDSYFSLVYQIVEETPVPPRQHIADIPIDLELICLKCLAKNPLQRYPDAKTLAQDLHDFVNQRPIVAANNNSVSLRKLISTGHYLTRQLHLILVHNKKLVAAISILPLLIALVWILANNSNNTAQMFRGDLTQRGIYRQPGVSAHNKMRWQFATQKAITSSPIVAGSTVYCGSDDHSLYAIHTANGKQKWRFVTQAPVYSSPAIYKNIVYFGSKDGYFYAVDAKTGEVSNRKCSLFVTSD